MIRSHWKHKYHNYYLIKKLERYKRQGSQFRFITIRNKATTLSKYLLTQLFKTKTFIRVYTGRVYISLNLGFVLSKTRLGEYVFTKWRTRRIHPIRLKGSQKGKNFSQRSKSKQRRTAVWSLRLRTKGGESSDSDE